MDSSNCYQCTIILVFILSDKNNYFLLVLMLENMIYIYI